MNREKKYQVFISSTYEDLKEERLAAIQTILEVGCIPVSMEQFPASNMRQMEYIQMMMDTCDYFILISAGRYGSIDPTDGIGYTEKEYDYAVSHKIPIMTFVFSDIDSLPADKKEKSDAYRQKLYAFREKIRSDKMVNYYTSKEELQAKIGPSLLQCILDFPAVGWIRAEGSEMGKAFETRLKDYIKTHNYQGGYTTLEKDKFVDGKTVINESIGERIVRIKHKIVSTILDTSWVKSDEDRIKLITNPWMKFTCNNVILKDETVEKPDFGNGLIKREPFNVYDEGILVGNPECSREVNVRLRDGKVIATTVYVVDEVPFRNITEFDEYGSINNPYPTFYCEFKHGSPFAGKQYIDMHTAMSYNEDQFMHG